MKKGLVAVVLLSLDLLFYIPISAQNLNKANKIENLKKNSITYGVAEAFSDGNDVGSNGKRSLNWEIWVFTFIA
ncbi:MAG: hypothetical protein H0V31_04345 [Acidobacteria bacterium]|nr:hypothetical protein [Acidobacteriota bacterium]